MSGYVELEDKNLTTFVTNSLNEENFKEEAEDGVLSSCKDYIFYAKKCGERCIQITQGKPLLDVCAQIAEHAEQYARGISAKCKENDTIRRCCLAINTSDYLEHCSRNIPTWRQCLVERSWRSSNSISSIDVSNQ
ncbi:hypothetical protein EIN_022420 [Entamoeba invadens IP1]|uniref:hypothetical protein n=1 Tax=Entamoeba invadens IP1 TaxID=370355 RepID=UPI0002C3F42F|nr:hypothetical protein EIN_022420 [Entamoeba invadens IP1]ELP90633.1 hypothetical protein EIN_022420 [Entamoeba invadens IP1]|eukprot:XP_004257404.1 hypothetical protein EIN_022420 [Entamoeba invadens IP1]